MPLTILVELSSRAGASHLHALASVVVMAIIDIEKTRFIDPLSPRGIGMNGVGGVFQNGNEFLSI